MFSRLNQMSHWGQECPQPLLRVASCGMTTTRERERERERETKAEREEGDSRGIEGENDLYLAQNSYYFQISDDNDADREIKGERGGRERERERWMGKWEEERKC